MWAVHARPSLQPVTPDRQAPVPRERSLAHTPPHDHAGRAGTGRRTTGDASEPHPHADDGTRMELERGLSATAPRWITVLAVVVVVLVIAMFIVLHLSGAVGPGAH